jgi:hypothetical protein
VALVGSAVDAATVCGRSVLLALAPLPAAVSAFAAAIRYMRSHPLHLPRLVGLYSMAALDVTPR